MSNVKEKHFSKIDKDNLLNAGIAGASAEIVHRYGSGVKEHIVAFSGKDNETGKVLHKSLKSVSREKLHPDYKPQNLRQQSGFSAEIKETARVNAEKIIRKDSARKPRTDDMGAVNHPIFDHIEVDVEGNIIAGSGSQMKFVGSSPDEALQKLASQKYRKYIEADAIIDVPSDYYEGIISAADEHIIKLQNQLDKQIANGSAEKATVLRKRIEDYQTIRKNLRKSMVSNEDAMYARMHPSFSTAKDIADLSHRAGFESVKYGVALGGSVSIVQNVVAVAKGSIEADEAIINVAKDTATSAAAAYSAGFAGAALKGAMQNSTLRTVQVLSKTSLPAIVASVAISTTKTIRRYYNGEISGVECFEELGEQGTGMIASAVGATIGQVVIPIPVMGGLIGGMIGYAIASASYGVLLSSMNEAKFMREERKRIETECRRQIELMKSYRLEIEAIIREYLVSHITVFQESFDSIKLSLSIGDVDGFIAGTNSISTLFGRETQFDDLAQFETIMESEKVFKL